MKAIIAAAVLALSTTVSAHGYVDNVYINGKKFPAFHPFEDLYNAPKPGRIVRAIPGDGPVEDFNSNLMRCNNDGSKKTSSHAAVAPGSEVVFQWNRWPTDHKGPVTTYMAPCPGGDCTNYDGSGKVWFKIDQQGLVSGDTFEGVFATDVLIANKLSWVVTVPKNLKSGAYLIRHEILALHSSGAPQFYPSCAQVVVTGSGTVQPASSDLVSIPGIYKSNTSTQINIYYPPSKSYPIAGPPVSDIAAGETNAKNKLGAGPGTFPTATGEHLSGDAVTKAIGSASTNNDDDDEDSTGTTTLTATATTKAAATTKASTTKAAVKSAKPTSNTCKKVQRKRNNAKRHAKKSHN